MKILILNHWILCKKPTHKAIPICNSPQPTHHQKLQKSMSLPTLTEPKMKKGQQLTSGIATTVNNNLAQ